MFLKIPTGPMLAIGGMVVWGIVETFALQRARFKTVRPGGPRREPPAAASRRKGRTAAH